jgi:hypothetical protein
MNQPIEHLVGKMMPRDAGAVACCIARPGRRSFGNILPMSELSNDMAVLLVSVANWTLVPGFA